MISCNLLKLSSKIVKMEWNFLYYYLCGITHFHNKNPIIFGLEMK